MKTNNNEHGSTLGFFRLFDLPATRFRREALNDLADAQVARVKARAGSKLPAGYTYFGQFVDHDISQMKHLSGWPSQGPIVTSDLVQLRDPGLNLDSLYGSGMDDPRVLVDPGTGEFKSRCTRINSAGHSVLYDLPRDQGHLGLLPRIPDTRNDENFLVAQMHVLFMNLHNRLMRISRGEIQTRFEKVRRQVTLIYQLLIRYDYLPRILDSNVHDVIFGSNSSPRWIDSIKAERPLIPIEFAAAAYRFGHSLVRNPYRLHSRNGNFDVNIWDLLKLTGRFGLLGQDTVEDYIVDWRHFFQKPGSPIEPRCARGISTTLRLSRDRVLREILPRRRSLTHINLLRGNEVGLPDAQSIIAHVRSRNRDYATAIGLVPFRVGDLCKHPIGRTLRKWEFHKKTPLWTYVLMERHLLNRQGDSQSGEHLGVLGSSIVGETFRSLLQTSQPSILFDMRYVRRCRFFKDTKIDPTKITMSDVVQFVGWNQKGEEHGH